MQSVSTKYREVHKAFYLNTYYIHFKISTTNLHTTGFLSFRSFINNLINQFNIMKNCESHIPNILR